MYPGDKEYSEFTTNVFKELGGDMSDNPLDVFDEVQEVNSLKTPSERQFMAADMNEMSDKIDLGLADENTPEIPGFVDYDLSTDVTSEDGKSTTLKVYLSGGNHSNWRADAKRYLKHEDIEFIDPYEGKQDTNYAQDNINHILDCDVVLGFKEASNPGLGLVAEVAFAAGAGKTTVLIVETGSTKEARYLGPLLGMIDYYTSDFESGLEQVNELAALKRKSLG